jgi:elongation factor G
VRDYLHRGPLGFPVVDVSVTLLDGSSHSVDSSDAAFQMAAKTAMAEGMANCSPVLLEPVMSVDVHTPSEHTSRINQIITSKRGHLLGFDGREGWPGWDTVRAHIPETELQTFIIELRSATQGAATFVSRFGHLAELAIRHKTSRVLSHIAHAGSLHDPEGNEFWKTLLSRLPSASFREPEVDLPHWSRFVSMPGLQRNGPAPIRWLTPRA